MNCGQIPALGACAELTRVSIIQDHLAVARVHPCLTDSLQAKLDPAAWLQLRQSELKAVLLIPEGHLLCDVVCAVEIEGGQEEVRVLVVLRAVPGQRDAAAAPGRHLEVLGNTWIW